MVPTMHPSQGSSLILGNSDPPPAPLTGLEAVVRELPGGPSALSSARGMEPWVFQWACCPPTHTEPQDLRMIPGLCI